jgi:hypothetical protein
LGPNDRGYMSSVLKIEVLWLLSRKAWSLTRLGISSITLCSWWTCNLLKLEIALPVIICCVNEVSGMIELSCFMSEVSLA